MISSSIRDVKVVSIAEFSNIIPHTIGQPRIVKGGGAILVINGVYQQALCISYEVFKGQPNQPH